MGGLAGRFVPASDVGGKTLIIKNSQKYFLAPQAVATNALAANNPVFRKPAILETFMGHHPQIKARAAYAPGNVGIGRQRTSHCVVLQAGLPPPTRAGETEHS